MLISHRKKFIYTKTAKTAGTSVEVYFEPHCFPENEWSFSHGRDEYVGKSGIVGHRGQSRKGKTWFNHMSARQIRDQIGGAIWDEYFKFCVIRDPFDKMVSRFHFHENRKMKMRHSGISRIISRITSLINMKKSKSIVERFREYIEIGVSVDSDKYLIGNSICVDYFIRFEDLKGGIKHVCNILGIPYEPEKLPTLKSGVRPERLRLEDYYDKRTIDLVYESYKWEIEHFGYTPPKIA